MCDEVVDYLSDDRSVRRIVVQRQRRRQRTRTIYLVSKYKGCLKKEEKKRKGEMGKRRFLIYPSGWQPVTALILGFDDSMLSQRLLINVLLKSCIMVLFMILVELVSMWLGSLYKDSPRFY